MSQYAVHEAGEAYFDAERRYRYALSRAWDPKKPMMLFIGLNPSTADEAALDPTLRRVTGFAMREGCGGFWMANLFAVRSTDPKGMLAHPDPVGPDNDRWIVDMARWCSLLIVGWGTHGKHRGRDMAVRTLLAGWKLECLGVNANGSPKHPLYLAKDTPLQTFQSHMWRG